MLPGFARDTVQIVRAGVTTDHGSSYPDWNSAQIRTISGCSFQPGSGLDDTNNRQAVGGNAQVFLPPGTDVAGSDRIVARGKTYEVVGEPQDWSGTITGLGHVVCGLHVWEG